MQTSTLFVLGLVLGALVVFGIRAVNLDSAEEGTSETRHEGHGPAQPAPAPAAAADEPAPAPAPEEPAPAPAPAPGADDDRPPENEICPVMGHEVDPDIYVDYEGRRIGFCCAGCDKKFLADPEKYLKKIDAELAARKGAK